MKGIQEQAHTRGYEVLTFGRFRLDPVRHTLHERDKRLHLGGRALEILIALTERTGQIVSKAELLSRVWPKGTAQEATLRVHITAVRKALGDGDGTRYVENFSGRGYRFVAPVRRQEVLSLQPLPTAPMHSAAIQRVDSRPAALTRVIGRGQIITALAARLPQCRFVTIVGPGGIGKSTVAAAAVEKLAGAYEHGIRVIDCSTVKNAEQLLSCLVLTLDPPPLLEEGTLSGLLSFLRARSILIVLDNCERVIEAIAAIAERILHAAPGVHLLATSREPLRAESECVHRLAPLGTPPALPDTLTRDEALAFPALQLFVERAAACMDSFALDDDDVPLLAQICRYLEGNPLAIELAAARVDVFGIRGLAARLSDSLRLLTRGRRTAVPRHQSLRAALDWSYELLTPLEQTVLRRLSVFSGPFDMESSHAVVEDQTIRAAEVLDTITNLVAKSVLMTEVSGDKTLYRLPEATRAYAFEKLHESHEVERTLLHYSDTLAAPAAMVRENILRFAEGAVACAHPLADEARQWAPG